MRPWTSCNQTCTVRPSGTPRHAVSPYNNAYSFHLGDVVDGETEYVVDVDHLLRTAREYGFTEVVLRESFANLFDSSMRGEDLLQLDAARRKPSSHPSAFDPTGFPDRSRAFLRNGACDRERTGEGHRALC